MKYSYLRLVILVFILIIFSYLLHLSSDPLLYSLEKEKPTTNFHINIIAQELISINTSIEMVPIMQALLDYSGPIALNIRMQDVTTAGADLEQYYQQYKNLDKLVINLEMSESELAEFQNNTNIQEQLFRELINASESLDTLKRLEFRYRDQNDITSLKTVAYQGESLKNKIQTIREKYNKVNMNIIEQGKKFDLNTANIEQARTDVNILADEISTEQMQRIEMNDFSITSNPEKSISLLVSPDSGKYRDRIHYSGFITGADTSRKNVTVLIDNTPYLALITDEIGQYSGYEIIDRIQIGNHIFTAKWNQIESKSQSFTVYPVNSSINLSIQALFDKPVIILSGILKANHQVINAPIHTIFNNVSWKEIKTDNQGYYKTEITLPEGSYQTYTLFNDSTFPIYQNQSEIYEVVSSGDRIISIKLLDDEKPLFLILLVTFVILGGIGAFSGYIIYHYREKNRDISHPFSEKEISILEDNTEKKNIRIINQSSSEDNLLAEFQSYEREFGLSEAVRRIYLFILNRISQDIQVNWLHSSTVREIIKKIALKPYKQDFSNFTGIYEKIRYGGSKKEEDKEFFIQRIKELMQAMEMKDNEK
ncbi:MAG: hypothetical protein GXY48_12560 [Methanomicrobiales archaeon]|nr:hypothetical protein [Methanomicrobiales archaeon]